MKVIIVTCTWNSEAYLKECIDSVQSQSHADIEHVFVDGGSTDGTLERIRALPGNIKLLTDVKGGISRAMNAGARVATGEILAHLHSDDFYLRSDVVATVVRAFERQPAALWLHGRCKFLMKGQLKGYDWQPKPYSWKTLLRGNIVMHPSTFVRNSAFRSAGGFDDLLKYAMDYDLWLRLAQMGPPIELDDYLAGFRFHDGSASTVNPWACHNECLAVRLKYVGSNPLARSEHYVRHVVRAGKMLVSMAKGERTGA